MTKKELTANSVPCMGGFLVPSHLLSGNGCESRIEPCMGCEEAIKKMPGTHRFFITMGHPGFNCAANNGHGFSSHARALWAMEHFASKGERK